MFTITDINDCQLTIIDTKWFKGNIYVDKRAKIFPFQWDILEKFILNIVDNSPREQKIDLNFHILVTGDPDGLEFTVDIFAFINKIAMDNQSVFNNAFSAIHYGINNVFTTIYQLYPTTMGCSVVNNNDESDNNVSEFNEKIDEIEEFIADQEKPEEKTTIH